MTWQIEYPRIVDPLFERLEPTDVLYDFDGPQLYVAQERGLPVLVYVAWSDDDELIHRLLVVPTSNTIIQRLREGQYSVCDALRQPWLHAVDQNYDGAILDVWHLEGGLDSVPKDYKPVEGTLLSLELEQNRVQEKNLSPEFVMTVAATEKAELKKISTTHDSLHRFVRSIDPHRFEIFRAWENQEFSKEFVGARGEFATVSEKFSGNTSRGSSQAIVVGDFHFKDATLYRLKREKVRLASHKAGYIFAGRSDKNG